MIDMQELFASGLTLLFIACFVFALVIFVWGFVGWLRDTESSAESSRLMKTSFYFLLISAAVCLIIVFFFDISVFGVRI